MNYRMKNEECCISKCGANELEMATSVGFQIKRISNQIGRFLNALAREKKIDDVTIMHGWIIQYLYDNQDKNVFQKDIEKRFSITKSTVTNIVQLMEKKGYIERKGIAGDARLKKLVLTEAGIKCHMLLKENLYDVENVLEQAFTKEEHEQFHMLINKLSEHLDTEIERKKKNWNDSCVEIKSDKE